MLWFMLPAGHGMGWMTCEQAAALAAVCAEFGCPRTSRAIVADHAGRCARDHGIQL
jgi:hypothetical protein